MGLQVEVDTVERLVIRGPGPEGVQASGGISAGEGGGAEALGTGRAAGIWGDGRESRTVQDSAAAGAVAGPDFRGFAADGAWLGGWDGDGHDSGRGDADG